MKKIDFQKYKFSPVVTLPQSYEVYDFSKGYDEKRILQAPYGIGKYNEKRLQMYKGELYSTGRDIHMGIDIGAPIGTPVMSFWEGEIFMTHYNEKELDYGYTIITKHLLDNAFLYALYGHLSKESLEKSKPGQKFEKGEVLGWVGNKSENGGWNPHLHLQLSLIEPSVCDMPGVVHEKDLKQALEIYPDPQVILGKLY